MTREQWDEITHKHFVTPLVEANWPQMECHDPADEDDEADEPVAWPPDSDAQEGE